MLREDKPCLTPPRPDSHPGSQGQPRSTAEMSEHVRMPASLLHWPLDLLTACVLVFSLLLTCMPSFGKKSALMKLAHLRVHSGFPLRYIRACVCLCFSSELRDPRLAFHQANMQVVKERHGYSSKLLDMPYVLGLFVMAVWRIQICSLHLSPKRPDEKIEKQQSLPAMTFSRVCI